jgi:hypothetical protein
MAGRIQFRRGTAAAASTANRVLANGEPGYEADTGRMKIGNGVDEWDDLPYVDNPPAGGLAGHLADTTDAHDASAISVVPTGGIAATTVQAALAELDTEKATTAALTAHLDDTTDAHDASAISLTPIAALGNPANVQDALAAVPGRFTSLTQTAGVSVRSMIFDDATAGQSAIPTDLATAAWSGTRVYSRKTADVAVLQISTNGSSISDRFTFTGEVINAIHVMASGAVLVFTSSTNTLVTQSTFVRIYRSTDDGVSFTRVDASVIPPDGYILPWGVASNGTAVFAGVYGWKGVDSDARFVYRSTDDGVTWTQVLDIGINTNRHVHAVFIDSSNNVWVTTGDDSASDGRTVYRSSNNGNTWTSFRFLDTDGTTPLQFVGITEHNGWIYLGEDNSVTGGRIFRCRASDPINSLQTVYDSNAGRRTTITPWGHPIYDMWTDPVHNIIYAYAPGETASNRGAFLISADGLNWSVLFEMGMGSVNPSAARFSSNPDSSFIYYQGFRIKRKRAAAVQQNASVQSEVLTFHWPGTLSTQAEKFAVDAGMLGFSFRVARITAFARVAGAGGPIVVTVKNGATTLCTADATIANGATGNARYADGTIVKTSMTQRFTAELNDKLVIDVTAGSGGSDLTVCIAIERQLFPLFMK